MVINKESVFYSLRNLNQSRARSFLTILSIFMGISTIFIFVSFGWGLFSYIDSISTSSSADKLIVQARGIGAPGLDDTFKLTDDDLDAVKGTAGVYDASGVYYKVAKVKLKKELKYVFLMAHDPKKPLIMEVFDINIDNGRELLKGDGGKVVLGYNYQIPNKIFSRGLKVNDNLEVEGRDLKIVGFYESIGNPQDDSNVYITNDFLDELYPGENSYGMLVARGDINNMEGVTERIEKNLRKERGLEEGKEDFFVQSFEDMIDAYSGALNIVIGFIILIALISVLVSAVNTANTMITSVLERTKEIGIIKSIGARNSEILKIFLFESSFLGFIAGVIGVIVGFGFTFIASIILNNLGWGFLSPRYSILLFVGCILFATLTGAVSGIVPAIRASRINTVDALRYE